MERSRLVPSIGVVAAVGVVLLLSIPYAVVSDPSGIGTYYGEGAINPLVAGLFAIVSIIVFAAAREERSDPALAAGAALALGVFTFVIVTAWALTVPVGVVTQFEVSALFEYHRFATAAVSFAMPVAAAWYARVIGVL